MKKIISLALAIGLVSAFSASAQDRAQGGITSGMMSQIIAASASNQNKAVSNAMAANAIDDLAKNYRNAKVPDTHFSIETPKQSIHNQRQSGRCWMYSSFNVLRANFAHRHGDSITVEFSHDYLFFYDQLEKANLMLQGVIDCADKPIDDTRVQFFFHHPINDGGTFCGVADLAEKYGLVPVEAQPETFSAERTSRMSQLLASKLREYGLELRQMVADKKSNKAINQRKTEMLGTIYSMLALTLGEPIKSFSYTFRDKNGKAMGPARTYTPLEFYRETVGGPINGTFIMAMNDPRREYYKTYEVEYDRHTYDGHNWSYVNLPMEDIAAMAIASLKDSTKLYASFDVGKQLNRASGYLALDNYDYATLFGTTFPMDKAQRIATFDSGSTHAMTICAVDLDDNGKPIKWKVENSWGDDSGHKGYIIMTNEWFNEYSFRLVVDKKYVPQNILKAAATKPVMIMPEDPLFGTDD
ncbi:MAG: C1 family peptidase [Muribaculaceae bacterium]|nr:C1 family peptidase [Muribaculaceae bacterium]